jgi:hypothetical protein
MQDTVEIVEVGPRDGLQSQPTLVDTDTKIEFITRLVDAGVRRLEVASFVNPKRVPQMADADEVIARLPRRPGVRYIGLVLNQRGFERAIASGIDQINSVAVASDTFCQRNQGVSSDEMFAAIRGMANEARAQRRFFGVTVAAAFGCPFEGEVPQARVLDMVRRYVDLGIDELALADTIGVAVPGQVARMVESVLPLLGERLRGGRGRRARVRRELRRRGRLPLRARRHRQRGHRGRGLHAAPHGLRDRDCARGPGRRRKVARRSTRRAAAGDGQSREPLPARRLNVQFPFAP